MNNEDFRKLVLAGSQQATSAKKDVSSSAARQGGAGLRQRPSFSLTPRSVLKSRDDRTRKSAEPDAHRHSSKKLKTSDPKGVGLATGYIDRTQERRNDETDERAERLKALEISFRKGEIERETYDEQRYAIAGGSLESTHLVKGLDFKLLQRIKQGEDVFGKNDGCDSDDVDEALDELEAKEVSAMEREKREKKGTFSTVQPSTGQHRTRNQILAEWKASRAAAKAKQQSSSLGDRFKRIGVKRNVETRIERDAKGREVLIIVDEHGNEKRKVRKLKGEEDEDLLMPDPNAKPLGMDVPEQYRPQQEAQEEKKEVFDFFAGIEDDYNPLAGIEESSSDSEEDSSHEENSGDKDELRAKETQEKDSNSDSNAATKAPSQQPARPRNYFEGSKSGLLSQQTAQAPSLSDPSIAAAIKKAASLKQIEGDETAAQTKAEKEAMQARRNKLLQMSERDNEDLDMGFGTSRFDDDDDDDFDGEGKAKLSVWGGQGKGGGDSGKGKRKRGPKKRKGDVNSAADVLRVMEQRKKA